MAPPRGTFPWEHIVNWMLGSQKKKLNKSHSFTWQFFCIYYFKILIDWLIDFNGMSHCLELFNAEMLWNRVYCTFIFTVFTRSYMILWTDWLNGILNQSAGADISSFTRWILWHFIANSFCVEDDFSTNFVNRIYKQAWVHFLHAVKSFHLISNNSF